MTNSDRNTPTPDQWAAYAREQEQVRQSEEAMLDGFLERLKRTMTGDATAWMLYIALAAENYKAERREQAGEHHSGQLHLFGDGSTS